MNRMIIAAMCLLLLAQAQGNPIPHENGTMLSVFANSGLKLRSKPDLRSEVLDVVQYGDQVLVLDNFDFTDEYSDRIDWIDGHWILVDYQGIAGYLFDGYLSHLSFPSSEEQLCQDGYSFAYTIGNYFDTKFAVGNTLDSAELKADYLLDQGIRVRKQAENGLWTLDLEIPDTKISDMLNLMRSMLPDTEARNYFDKNLIYIEGADGKIKEVRSNYGNPVTIKRRSNNSLLVKASGNTGC